MAYLILGVDILLSIVLIAIRAAFSRPHYPQAYSGFRNLKVVRMGKPQNPFEYSPPGENIALIFGILCFPAYMLNYALFAIVFSVIAQAAASYYWGSVLGYKFRTPLQYQMPLKLQPHLVTVVSWLMGFSIIVIIILELKLF